MGLAVWRLGYNEAMQSASKVGGLVILFAVLLIGAYAALQKSLFSRPTDTYFAKFQDAGGLTTGAPVFLSGVQVGSVSKIALVRPGEALIEMSIQRGQSIPEGSQAVLPSSFIAIGDKQLLIIPPAETANLLPPGATIPGVLQKPLDDILPNTEETVAELNKTLVAVQKLLEDQQLTGGVKSLMATSEQTVEKFGSLAGRIDGFIANNQSHVAGMIRTTQASLMNLQAVSEEVKKLVASGELQGKTTELLDNLNAAVVQGRQLVTDLQATVNDPEIKASVKGTLKNFETMSESGTRIAVDAEALAKNGVVISDETVALMKKANKLAADVESLIESFKKTVEKIEGQGKSLMPRIEAEAIVTRETSPGRTRADVNIDFNVGQDRFMVGLYDAFESNKINAQLYRALGPGLDLRYGVYASKPGLGVDYAVAPNLKLRGDLFGLNDPQLDFRMRYDFGKGINGWLGLERVFEKNAPSFGIGIRK